MTDNYAINTHRKFLICIVFNVISGIFKEEIFEIVIKLLEKRILK